MKTRGLIILGAVILAVAGLCCSVAGLPVAGLGVVIGSGRVVEEVYEVSDFTGVELATSGDLVIEIGEEEELRVEAEDNLIEYLEVEVRGGMLKIRTRPGVWVHSTRSIKFYLTARTLDAIVLSGSGDIEAPDLAADAFSVTVSGSGDVEVRSLEAEALSVRISGSGDLDIAGGEIGDQDVVVNGSGGYKAGDVAGAAAERISVVVAGSGDVALGALDADLLEVQVAGSGDVRVAGGEVEEQRVTINGSGSYKAREMESAEAKVNINGSGSATVWARELLDVRIAGSGDVHYAGSPEVRRSVLGSGSVGRIGE